jgi:molybdate transport system substrate-binding protein
MFVRLLAVLGLFGALAAAPQPAAAQQSLTVFAAASLKNALDDASAAFSKATGVKVVASYEASSALAKQIEQGAPADVFISADLAWMD